MLVEPKVVSERDAADMLSLSLRGLQNLRARGEGPKFIRLSPRRLGYLTTDIFEWITSRARGSNAEDVSRRKEIDQWIKDRPNA